jgi:hypothetical protein
MLSNIVWPIYAIRSHASIQTRKNILYITTEYGEYVLDNKNLKGNTLGIRRLKLKKQRETDKGFTLYPLSSIYYTFEDVLQGAKFKIYIDSIGTLHNFTRKTRRDLKYYKVQKTQVHANSVLCFCRGLTAPILINYIPTKMPLYLGLVKINGSLQIYELSNKSKPNTWRLL